MSDHEAQDTRSRFLALMSHELRTPLNVIIGFADQLARDARSPTPPNAARVAEFATAIHDAGHGLLGLVNTVLDVARIEQGRFELQADTIDIAHLVGFCITAASEPARKAQLSLTTSVATGKNLLRGDERRLRQVLTALLANAIAFTRPGGKVHLSATHEAGSLVIAVTDTGIGIAPDQLDLVFEPFSQADASLSRRSQGVGLGLYVCRALIAAHGGTLTLTSEPGVGTAVRITLPPARLLEPTASAVLSQESP